MASNVSTPLDPAQIEARIEELLTQMTLEEKVSLLSGKNAWQTVSIERLGIPSLTMTDGPHGVRANHTGPERISGPATSFPTGISMAASWDPELIERVGAALAEETRAMGCDILLGPCVNIMRTPLAGRNFESYSEDPYLAGRIGIAWVTGLQSKGIGASLKHYACNNQETERFRGDSVVDERTLREIYLAQFEAIVKKAQPWTVMCAYNRINGIYASQHAYLLNKILRDEWGFEGVVISDWGANHTIVESVSSGLDIEMPGPAKYYWRLLVEAVRNWQVEESTIDAAVRRVLRMLFRSGKMNEAAPPPGEVNTPAHQALARELAEASITLLKNDGGVLPLKDVSRLAVIGPNAAEARIGGGGSSYLEPPYRVSPLEGLRARFGDNMHIEYAQGCDNTVAPPALKPNVPIGEKQQIGFLGRFYRTPDFSGDVLAERVDPYLDEWYLHTPQGVPERGFSARWEGAYRPEISGRYHLRLRTNGMLRLFVDDKLILDTTADSPGETHQSSEVTTYLVLDAGRVYRLRVDYVAPVESGPRELRVLARYEPLPEDDNRLARAVALARDSDVAVVFAGMPQGFESEGYDRPDMTLPGPQDELIHAVAAANPRTIVVLNCGAPVEMPWIEEVAAVLLAYYPGQEGGHAIARILAGDVTPSGKLPVTFPRRYEDNPTFLNYPGTRQVRYGEGLFVGYRYYDRTGIEPLFPFGFGLSYTTFEYHDLEVPAQAPCGESVEVAVTVTNTGTVAGQEVIQLYVTDHEASLERPVKELKGFRKVRLDPGESTRVTFLLDARAFAFYDPYQAKDWVVEPGAFDILVGSSSRDIRLQGTLQLV